MHDANDNVLDRTSAQLVEARVIAVARSHDLSARESQILVKLASGIDPKAIGHDLGCAYSTVRTHLRRIARKLGCGGTREILIRLLSEIQ